MQNLFDHRAVPGQVAVGSRPPAFPATRGKITIAGGG